MTLGGKFVPILTSEMSGLWAPPTNQLQARSNERMGITVFIIVADCFTPDRHQSAWFRITRAGARSLGPAPLVATHEPEVERDRAGLLPLPARNERGEGWGEGKSNKDGLLSPALSSFVPQEEREKSSVQVEARISRMTSPCTSVRRRLDPLCRKVSFSWSMPRRCRMVAWRS